MPDPTQQRIQFRFDERKATAAAAYFLHRAGGQMDRARLMKLLYLAERRCLQENRFPLCGDRMASLKYGPVLSATLDLMRGQASSKTWPHVIGKQDHRNILLVKEPPLGPLCPAEIAILSAVYEEHRERETFELCDWTHDHCQEWHDPGSSSTPISVESLLEVIGATEAEVGAMAAEARDQAYFASLFSAE